MYVWATSFCVGCDRVLVGLTVGSVMGRVGRQGEGGGRRAGRERAALSNAPWTRFPGATSRLPCQSTEDFDFP